MYDLDYMRTLAMKTVQNKLNISPQSLVEKLCGKKTTPAKVKWEINVRYFWILHSAPIQDINFNNPNKVFVKNIHFLAI